MKNYKELVFYITWFPKEDVLTETSNDDPAAPDIYTAKQIYIGGL